MARDTALVEMRVPVPDRPGVLAEITTLLGELDVNIEDLEIAHSVEGERGVLVLVVQETAADVTRTALLRLPTGLSASPADWLRPECGLRRALAVHRRPAGGRCGGGSPSRATSRSPTGR